MSREIVRRLLNAVVHMNRFDLVWPTRSTRQQQGRGICAAAESNSKRQIRFEVF